MAHSCDPRNLGGPVPTKRKKEEKEKEKKGGRGKEGVRGREEEREDDNLLILYDSASTKLLDP
jgi:hypothetical protein